jgi:hypothetical protein
MRERNDSTLALPATSCQDVLTGLLGQGAQRMLAEAIDAEVAEYEAHCQLRDEPLRSQVAHAGGRSDVVGGAAAEQVVDPRT